MRLTRRQLRKIILNEIRSINESDWKDEYESLENALKGIKDADWKKIVKLLNQNSPDSANNLFLTQPITKKAIVKLTNFFKESDSISPQNKSKKDLLKGYISSPEYYYTSILRELFINKYILAKGNEVKELRAAIEEIVSDAFTS